jgi:serine/threonine-protein kinase
MTALDDGAPRWPSAPAISAGRTIAEKYLLEAPLGEGGMGVVFRARNTLLGRVVAIKVLRPEIAGDDETREAFLREARSASAVRHPNVVDVLDVGFDGDLLYIVQECLSGETLAARLEAKHRLSEADTLAVVGPIVAAVAHAHARGVLHRDIKPDNVFLTRDGEALVPKLVDFGLAQSTDSKRSLRDTISGSPEYMSPALVTNARVADATDDVWALGVMMYECLAGVMPFSGETVQGLFFDIANNEPTALERLCPELSSALVEIVERCLSKRPERSFADASALAVALEPLLPAAARKRTRTATSLAVSELTATQSAPPAAAPPATAPLVARRRGRASMAIPLVLAAALAGLVSALGLQRSARTAVAAEHQPTPVTAPRALPAPVPPVVTAARPAETLVVAAVAHEATAPEAAALDPRPPRRRARRSANARPQASSGAVVLRDQR